jgi:hypothetical protein
MNISINLTAEQSAAVQKRVDAANASDPSPKYTQESYLKKLIDLSVDSWVSEDIRQTALSIEAATRRLPDESRLAFTVEVIALYQQYATGQKP